MNKELSEITAEDSPARKVEPPVWQCTLDSMIGNRRIREFLKKAVGQDRLPQAILLTGSDGVGKTTMAWALAREIISGGIDPANHPGVRKICCGGHPDLIELSGGRSASSLILVRDIRDMEDKAWKTPSESPLKFILIEPAHKLHRAAASALLKTLEEPPATCIFILISSQHGRIPDTIRSRTTNLPLEPVQRDELCGWLGENRKLSTDQAEMLAGLSEGRPGYAVQLNESGLLDCRKEVITALELIINHGYPPVFAVADRLCNLKPKLEEVFLMALSLLRDALVYKCNNGESALNSDLADSIKYIAEKSGAEGLLEASEIFERACKETAGYYTLQAQHHFTEIVLMRAGKCLRSRDPGNGGA